MTVDRLTPDAPMMLPPGTYAQAPLPVTNATRVGVRPQAAWMAALVAFGVFCGLVVAVVVRGDGDSLLGATASFVDPAAVESATAESAAAAGESTEAASIPEVAAAPARKPKANARASSGEGAKAHVKHKVASRTWSVGALPSAPEPADAADEDDATAEDEAAALAAPHRPAARRVAVRAKKPARRTAPRRRTTPPKQAAVARVKSVPAPTKPAAPKPASAKGDDDGAKGSGNVSDAEAANELAKAQLEASLR